MRCDRQICLAAQVQAKTNEPAAEDIYKVGTVGQIMQHIKRPDGTVKVLIEGRERVRLERFVAHEACFMVEATTLRPISSPAAEEEALQRTVQDTFESYARLSKRLQADVLASIRAIDDASRLADTIIAHLPIKHPDKQSMLEMEAPSSRLEKLCELMQAEIEILQVERKIRTRVKRQMERTEKEYYLNEQMRAIQKELGDRDEFKNEIGELEDKLKGKEVQEEVRTRVAKEIKKLKMMSPMSAEATVVRNYIDWCLALPWNTVSADMSDMAQAESILDEDHWGLKKPKERILEYLAVHTLVERMRGPILCMVGPPGVGKTSLARSMAKAMGREFVRLSLGGVRDEAEIRGHRRTYIGAMPGKIIQSLKRAGSSNPVFLLDEIDKMSTDFRGDPSAALLEVLDPEQNTTFNDHYLDLDYDLSRVMFICTANNMQGIPPALEDRLEVIRIAGYTEMEKMAIAKKYLVPKERRDNGVGKVDMEWAESATRAIVRLYTREAGVRTLEREIASVCRKVAREVVAGDGPKFFKINAAKVKEYLGVPKFRANRREEKAEVGVATGLAWTQNGGEILKIEVAVMPGKGKLTITGKLGDVMQESARAALSYVRTRAMQWGLAADFAEHSDIHVHVPEGAIPKDGPSAGITMASALVSALTKVPLQPDVAMTGEITLLGRVLPIGGLKEKALAAHAARISKVVLPRENKKDLDEVPGSVARALTFICVEHMDEVIKHALCMPEAGAAHASRAAAAAGESAAAPAVAASLPTPAAPVPPGVQEH